MKKLLLLGAFLLGGASLLADTCTSNCTKQLNDCKKWGDAATCTAAWENCLKKCPCNAACEEKYNRCRGGFSSASQCQERKSDCLDTCKR